MKKRGSLKKWLCMVLSAVIMFSSVCVIPTNAASESVSKTYNGKWTYYAVGSTIYKVDSTTGKSKKIKQINKVHQILDIVYHAGYLYFTANYFYGPDNGGNVRICRMKTDGSDYKKMGQGSVPVIYDNKIYYLKSKHVTTSEGDRDELIGIACMSLTGKNSKLIIKNSTDYGLDFSLGVVNGKLFYTQMQGQNGDTALMSYDIKNKETEKVFTNSCSVNLSGFDQTYVYMSAADNEIVAYNTKTGKVYEKVINKGVNAVNGWNGIMYFINNDDNATYAYNVKTDKVTTFLKNKRVNEMIFSKSGYQVVNTLFTMKQFEANGYQYAMEKACVKLKGKGYKSLNKY